MTLLEFLKHVKKLVDENPQALHMEMFAMNGASGATDPISHPFVDKINEWDNSEFVLDLPKDYKYDSVIRVYTGN